MMSTDQVPSEKQEEKKATSEKKENFSPSLLSFKELFAKQENLEERLRMTIEFMRESLSQKGAPRFKDFWEAKKMCLPLFKEKINPLLKGQLWITYTELSSEIKRLKDLLEEESGFAIEQIDLALQALETDLSRQEELVQKYPSIEAPSLGEKGSFYNQKQKEIQFYMTLTGRLKDLRQEIIDTEMRIRHKNRLFKRLSAIGDLFLPKKKELIKKISEEFVKDVECFADNHFDKTAARVRANMAPLYKLREEIQGFQLVAKKLFLNAQAFSKTRECLSQCWEIIKLTDREKKKELLDQKQLFKEHVEKGTELIEAFSRQWKDNFPKTREEVDAKYAELVTQLEALSLSGSDIKLLKTKLAQAKEEALAPITVQEKLHLAKRQEKESLRQEQLELFKQELYGILNHPASVALEVLRGVYEGFEEKKKSLKPEESESSKLNEMKKELYEVLLLRREEEIKEEDKKELEVLLKDWEEFREITRMCIELYRQKQGSSGFDFERAMLFRKQADLEKLRLDRAVKKVEELEDRLE